MKDAGGLFGISEDHTEAYQSLDERFITSKSSTFFFEAANNSMSPYIEVGDILIVDRAITPINNQIIIGALEGELICRRLCFNQSLAYLTCDNPKFKTLEIKSDSDFVVWGTVKAIARDVIC